MARSEVTPSDTALTIAPSEGTLGITVATVESDELQMKLTRANAAPSSA